MAELKIGSLEELTRLVCRYAVVMLGPKYTDMWRASVQAPCDHTLGVCAWCKPFAIHGGCEHLYDSLVQEKKLRLDRPWEKKLDPPRKKRLPTALDSVPRKKKQKVLSSQPYDRTPRRKRTVARAAADAETPGPLTASPARLHSERDRPGVDHNGPPNPRVLEPFMLGSPSQAEAHRGVLLFRPGQVGQAAAAAPETGALERP